MKGFLAMVIASCWLGSNGFAQQNQEFDRTPIPDRNTMGRQMDRGSAWNLNEPPAGSTQSDSPSRNNGENQGTRRPVGRLDLIMNDDMVQELRSQSLLEATFPEGASQNINEICIGYPEPMQMPGGSFGLIEPSERREGVLLFDFGETDLQKIRNSTLRYRLEPEEVGRYRIIAIRYRGASRPQPPQGGAADVNSFANSRNNDFAGQSNLSGASDNLRPPAIDSFQRDSGSRSAAGPVDPFRGFNSDSSVALSDRRNDWPTDRQNRNQADMAFDQSRSSDNNPLMRPLDSPATSTTPYTNDRRQYLQDYLGTQLTDSNRPSGLQDIRPTTNTNPRSNELAEWEQTLRRIATDLQRREKQLESDERFLLEQAVIAKQRLNEMAQGDQTGGLPRDFKLTSESTMNDREKQYLLSRLDLAEKSNRSLTADLNELHSDFKRLSDVVYQGGVSSGTAAATNGGRFSRNDSGMMPNLKSENNNVSATNSDRSKGFPGSSNSRELSELEQKRIARNQGVLYFFLVGSLSLNLYLAWISRNFYVRYGELADELRETFASSN